MRMAFVLFAITLEVAALHASRWPSDAHLVVWIDPAGAPAGATQLVTRALAAWTDAVGRRITLEAGSRDVARIQVHFAGGRGLYGETRPRLDPLTGSIRQAEVVIATDTAGDDPLTQRIVLYLTALHELGHAIGLPHTDNFADIMYSFRRPDDGERYFMAYRRRLQTPDDVGSLRASGLSANDVAAVRALYAP